MTIQNMEIQRQYFEYGERNPSSSNVCSPILVTRKYQQIISSKLMWLDISQIAEVFFFEVEDNEILRKPSIVEEL